MTQDPAGRKGDAPGTQKPEGFKRIRFGSRGDGATLKPRSALEEKRPLPEEISQDGVGGGRLHTPYLLPSGG